VNSARAEAVRILAQQGRGADEVRGPVTPFPLPAQLSLARPAGAAGFTMAYLTDDRGNPISPALRIELIAEIVRRYNAHP